MSKSSNGRKSPDPPTDHCNPDLAKLGRDPHQAAIEDYDEAIRTAAGQPDRLSSAHCGRALAKTRLGQHQAAIEDYDEAIRTAAGQPDRLSPAHYGRALAKTRLGQHQAAIEDYDEAIRTAAGQPDRLSPAHYGRALAKTRLGQHQAAIEDYDEAIRWAAGQPRRLHSYYYSRALAKTRLGQNRAAIKDYDEAIRLASDNRKGQYRMWRDALKHALQEKKRRFAAEEKREPNQSMLNDVIQRIVEVAKPEKIILFGSAAKGEMGPGSDLDLLIVRDGINDSDLISRIYDNLSGNEPVDAVLVTPKHLERYKNSNALMYKHALSEGRVVYESAS